jgi:hypothetical protein
MPVVRRIVRESDGYRMKNLILGIVRSDAFRMRTKQAGQAAPANVAGIGSPGGRPQF